MRFVKESVSQFARAKVATWSKNYVVCSTGGQIKIFDKNFNLLQVIKGVKYVYNCLISPDEKKLLLISIANFFYIVELDTFRVIKHTVKGKYSDNLEGRGCWSFDGKSCCFCVEGKQESKSALRIYKDIQNDEYEDLLCDKYFLTSILNISEHNTYLLTGYNHDNDKNYLIWYDGKVFEEFLIEQSDMLGLACRVKYDKNNDCYIVIGLEGTVICQRDGKRLKSLILPQTGEKAFSFADIFNKANLEEQERREIASLSVLFGFENMIIPDTIVDVCYLNKGQYLVVATLKGVLCINTETQKIEAIKDFSYGAKGVEVISDDMLLVTTWESLEFLRIVFD